MQNMFKARRAKNAKLVPTLMASGSVGGTTIVTRSCADAYAHVYVCVHVQVHEHVHVVVLFQNDPEMHSLGYTRGPRVRKPQHGEVQSAVARRSV
jgi:hypothetical protein